MTKPTYRAGTPSARRRAQKAANTRAAKARAHEAELAARRERDRARREAKRQAEARARWERERRLAERRERAASKAAPSKKKVAPAKKKAAPAKKKAAPAKKKAALAKKKAAPAKKKAAPAKKKAAPSKKRAPRKPTRAQQRSAAARKGWDTRRRRQLLRTRWEQFAFEAEERARTPVAYEDAIRAGVDPLDPTAATGWQLLTVYVKSTRRAEFNERLEEYLDVVDAWLATGLLPPRAYELPVDKWETSEFTGTGARALGKLFEADSTSTAGLRCVPSLAPSDESRFEVWKSSAYVKREKRRNLQRAAKRRRGD